MYLFRTVIALLTVALLSAPVFAQAPATLLNLGDASAPHLFEPETGLVTFSPAHMADMRVLGTGWKNPVSGYLEMRDDGLWCTSLVSELHLRVVAPRTRELVLRVRPHLIKKLGPQILEIYWGSARLGVCNFSLERGWDFVDFTFPVPADVQTTGDNKITINARYAVSAQSMETGDDGTIYSYAIQHLELRDAGGASSAPAELTFVDGTMLQPPYSRVVLPVRVPESGQTHFLLDGLTGSDDAKLLIQRDGINGPKTTPVELDGNAAVEVALSNDEGALLSILFETGASAVEWHAPRVEGPAPPLPKPDYQVTGKPKAKNVVLILCDAMARDRLGAYGDTRDASPTMDRLAREGVQFMHAYSSASYTYSSTWSLMTGLYPFQHDAPETPLKVNANAPRLAQVLNAAGVHTGVVSAQHWISPPYSTTEYFDEYINAIEPPKMLEVSAHPELVTERAEEFIARNKENPFFLYLHYRPPHEPYYPPEAYLESIALDPAKILNPDREFMGAVKDGYIGLRREPLRHLLARYAEMIRSIDEEIRKVVATLKSEGLGDDTLVIITSDHGEAFMEHDWFTHGHTLYDEVAGIPFILWGADVASLFELHKVEAPIGNVSLFPTIADVFNAEIPEGLAASSLFRPQARGEASPRTMAQNSWRKRTHLWDPLDAYWWTDYKLIVDPVGNSVEVYDITRDPDEKSDLAQLRPVLRDYLRANAAAWRVEESKKFVGPAEDQNIEQSQESLDALDALGYI